MGNKPLYKRVKESVDETESEAKSVHFWENGVGWKWELLQQRLPAIDLARLVSISLSSNPLDCYRMGWLKLGGKKFSLKTTYQLSNDWMEGSKLGRLEIIMENEDTSKSENLCSGRSS